MLKKEIGGYFGLEIKEGKNNMHKGSIAVNSARNGIYYLIKAYNIKSIHVPYYTCPVVWDKINKAGCNIEFYNINEKFLPVEEFNQNDYILYTNYFGICSDNVKKLAKKYPNLIVDNAQAFYMKPFGIGSVYSPRKFFPLPDGGLVYSNKILEENIPEDITSHLRFNPLLMRLLNGAEYGYSEWKNSEDIIDKEPLQVMSKLTSLMMSNIDYNKCKKIRLQNFKYLSKALNKYNNLKFEISDDVPLYYPLLIENDNIRPHLIKSKIFIHTFWKDMETQCKKDSYEMHLKEYLLPLYLDQRYDIKDMERVVDKIKEML